MSLFGDWIRKSAGIPIASQTPADVELAERLARSSIALHIVYWALGAVTVLGVVAMLIAWRANPTFKDAKDVLAMLLPVIGAWVGTVLAFYFSRENYLAATQNNAALIGLTLEQRLQSIQARSVMLHIAQVDALTTDAPDKEIKLVSDILDSDALSAKKRNRLPILGKDGVVRYVVHRSMVDRFCSETAKARQFDITALTLADFVGADEYKAYIASFASVRPDASLSAVKASMDGNPKCQDVIVTADGSPQRPALGWITNVIVLEHAKA